MLAMNQDSQIMAGQLAGDFVLWDDPYQKCVFIAGGIGITPFRSMIQYLLDKHESRPIVLFYVNRKVDEIVYTNVLNRALRDLRIRTFYTLTDPDNVPAWWRWRVGHITPQALAEEVPDYRNCMFYISGPSGMVTAYRKLLRQLDVPDSQIKTDFFPGFA
jgi:ferredoxin-NADP reductase